MKGRRMKCDRLDVEGAIVSAVFCVLAVLFVLVPFACAAEIPLEAERYRRDLIREARAVWGLDAPTSALAAQVHAESYWQPDARSWAGALGLTQFMTGTADWIAGEYPELGSAAPLNPRWALRAQARYMHWLGQRVTGATECEDWGFAWSAYNGGLGWVQKRKARSERPEVCFGATCEINPGILASNQRENAAYGRRVRALERDYFASRRWGSRGICWRWP